MRSKFRRVLGAILWALFLLAIILVLEMNELVEVLIVVLGGIGLGGIWKGGEVQA